MNGTPFTSQEPFDFTHVNGMTTYTHKLNCRKKKPFDDLCNHFR